MYKMCVCVIFQEDINYPCLWINKREFSNSNSNQLLKIFLYLQLFVFTTASSSSFSFSCIILCICNYVCIQHTYITYFPMVVLLLCQKDILWNCLPFHC